MAAEAQHDFWGTLSVIAITLCGVATIAVLVSKNAQTPSVIQSGGQAFSNALAVAISPVTGTGLGSSSMFPIG